MAHADPGPLRRAFAVVNDNLLATSEREARAGAKIITWPEAGAATIAQDRDDLIARVAALARSNGAYLAVGLGVVTEQPPYLQNQAVLVDPQGGVAWTYDKAHPVPGLEVFTPGDGRVPTADTPYGRLATVICFDADFPDLMHQAGSSRVDLMLVPSNDWREFGVVHAQKAAIRAVENGYSRIRPDTHGLAQTVDYQGHVLASSDYFTTDQQVMVAYVPSRGTRTIYAMIGDLFVWLCLAGLVLLTGAAAYRTTPLAQIRGSRPHICPRCRWRPSIVADWTSRFVPTPHTGQPADEQSGDVAVAGVRIKPTAGLTPEWGHPGRR
jgi:apolipoprotein N-acyltransferase